MRTNPRFKTLLPLTLCALQLACSDDPAPASPRDAEEPTTPASDAGRDGSRDAGRDASQSTDAGTPQEGGEDEDPEAKVGEFGLQLVAPVPAAGGSSATPGFTSLLGKVYDGPAVEAIVWEKQREADGCRLLTPRYPFCDPGCGSAICIEDDMCRKSPTSRSVGKVTVTGLKASVGTVTVSPVQNSYTTPALAYPAFEEGAEIELSAAGGDLPAFSVTSHGIAPLTLSADTYVLEDGKPLALKWKAPAAGGDSRIQVKLDISHHGGTKGKIECDVADSGSLAIPADLVDELKSLGVAGFPTVMVTRSAVGATVTTAGTIHLKVYSYVEQTIEIPGLVSCTDDDECAPKKCQDDKTCG